MKSGIYVIAHPSSGRCYVGSSVDVPRRWKRHQADLRQKRHHSFKLQRVATESLVFSFVEATTDLAAAEQRWIDLLDSVESGFNVCPDAGTAGTLPKTAEHKAKIGAAHRGMKRSDEARARISEAMSGKKRKPLSDAQKAKISAAKKGRPMSDAAKAKLSAFRSGVSTGPCSDQRRENIRAAKLGKPLSEFHKQRISEGLKARRELALK